MAVASITNASFFVNPRSHIIDAIPFGSHPPSTAARKSASALLLAMVFLFVCVCFQHVIADKHRVCN